MTGTGALKIYGSGSSSGGIYSKIRVMGEGRISGDTECFIAKTFGSSVFDQDIQADEFTVYGTSIVRGKLLAKQIKIYGDADFNDSDAEELNVWGNLDIFGTHTGEKVNTKGNLTIKGNCEVDQFLSKGMFTVLGLLSADVIDIGLKFGISKVQEMGGERINVRKDISLFSHKRNPLLVADTIEGDDIFLENTKAKIVRGNHVHIGQGCEIDSVEYFQTYKVSRGANVQSSHKYE